MLSYLVVVLHQFPSIFIGPTRFLATSQSWSLTFVHRKIRQDSSIRCVGIRKIQANPTLDSRDRFCSCCCRCCRSCCCCHSSSRLLAVAIVVLHKMRSTLIAAVTLATKDTSKDEEWDTDKCRKEIEIVNLICGNVLIERHPKTNEPTSQLKKSVSYCRKAGRYWLVWIGR